MLLLNELLHFNSGLSVNALDFFKVMCLKQNCNSSSTNRKLTLIVLLLLWFLLECIICTSVLEQ